MSLPCSLARFFLPCLPLYIESCLSLSLSPYGSHLFPMDLVLLPSHPPTLSVLILTLPLIYGRLALFLCVSLLQSLRAPPLSSYPGKYATQLCLPQHPV